VKVYGDLNIELQGLSVSECIDLLEAVEAPQWRRNHDMEKDIRGAGSDMYCFDFTPTVDTIAVPAAHVWLAANDEGTAVYVPNIIPIGKSELTVTEYNAVRDRFFEDVVAEAIEGRLVHLSKVDIDVDDVMSEETAKALKTFSAAANKSTGSSHPMDQKRWFDFIIKCFKNDDRVGPDFVGNWLTEQGWDERHIRELRSEFEQGLSLLRQNAARN